MDNLQALEEFEKNETQELTKTLPSTAEGYRILNKTDLPFFGYFYPENWNFAYRCPTTSEVANFSTLNPEDQSGIISAIVDLIKKCFFIVDIEKENQVSTENINDGDRLFFFLKLREFYMNDNPIKYIVMNSTANELVEVALLASSLNYPELSDELKKCFNNETRKFKINYKNEVIEFLMPTLNITQKIFNYMLRQYKEVQKDNGNVNSIDKQFLLFAPFLYEEGNETIENLKIKFKNIKLNNVLYQGYLGLINNLQLTNNEKIVYEYQGSMEETLIKFPGGWKNIFNNKSDFGNLFK